jgi:hypothetical protein
VLALVCYFNYHLLYFSIFMGIVYTCWSPAPRENNDAKIILWKL